MKTRIIKVTFVAAIAMVSAINAFKANKNEAVSDIALANLEALNDDEMSIYDYKQPKTVVCDLVEGPWHTGAVERICEFCAVPYTCTPMPCGGN